MDRAVQIRPKNLPDCRNQHPDAVHCRSRRKSHCDGGPLTETPIVTLRYYDPDYESSDGNGSDQEADRLDDPPKGDDHTSN